MRRTFFLLLVVAVLLVPFVTSAIRFPDISSNFAHKTAVEELSDIGVINGNPDGTFRPHDPINRAAMLKMLYKAAKRDPEKAGGCFGDIEQGSWYEMFVCDAVVHGFVQGYSMADGARVFKPAQPVTRAEAIKLTLAVLGIPDAELSAAVTMYSDVDAADWYARFVHTALAEGILPIPGQDGATFSPHQLLERGEAAAYIWNALPVRQRMKLSPASSSSSVSSLSDEAAGAVSAALSEIEKRAQAAERVAEQERKALERAQANTSAVSVPFSDKRTFDGRTTFSYEFSVTAVTMVDVLAAPTDWNMGTITCRLYHLGRSGFTQEYYLGFQDNKNCLIHAALAPGNWRLELKPEQLSPTFTVSVKTGGKSDGNDGFAQAATLPLGQPRSESLTPGDLEDWYTFKVPNDEKIELDGGREMVLRVSSEDPLGCLIYPLDDVDQYGFTGPECGYKYLYPAGTYMVSVRHAPPLGTKQTYTIQVQ